MVKKNVNAFFTPIDIAKGLMNVQQGKINRQIVGEQRRKRRTLFEGEPIDQILDQLVQEQSYGNGEQQPQQ
jgi:hypothetical protein